MSTDPYRVPAVVGAVRALDALAAHDGAGATLSELAREIGRSKSTVFNLLSTLQAEGLVTRDPGTRRYHLGARLVPLGQAAAREARPLAVALTRARGFAGETGLSVAVAQTISRGREAQVVDSAAPPSGLHVGITIGDRYGVYDGAIGKTLLAGLPPEECERTVRERPVTPHTERTLTDPDDLLDDIARVRERGWAASVGELNENNAVSACVAGQDGSPALVLVVLGFASQLPADRVPEIGARLAALTESVTIETGGLTAAGGVVA